MPSPSFKFNGPTDRLVSSYFHQSMNPLLYKYSTLYPPRTARDQGNPETNQEINLVFSMVTPCSTASLILSNHASYTDMNNLTSHLRIFLYLKEEFINEERIGQKDTQKNKTGEKRSSLKLKTQGNSPVSKSKEPSSLFEDPQGTPLKVCLHI